MAARPEHDGQQQGGKWSLCPRGSAIALSKTDSRRNSHKELTVIPLWLLDSQLVYTQLGLFVPSCRCPCRFHRDLPKRAALQYYEGLPPPR
jgi:hypothetical protein